MSEITPKTFPKLRPHPLIANLPLHLKDPANYDRIQKTLFEALATTHSHSDIFEWSTCKKCSKKLIEFNVLIRKLGFESGTQYMVWKRTHEKIKERYPLMDWKKKNEVRRLKKLKSNA